MVSISVSELENKQVWAASQDASDQHMVFRVVDQSYRQPPNERSVVRVCRKNRGKQGQFAFVLRVVETGVEKFEGDCAPPSADAGSAYSKWE